MKDVEYAVYRDSLVYIFDQNGIKRAGVLTSYDTIIKQGDVLYICEKVYGAPTKATIEDFNHYRVLPPKGLFPA